MKTHWDGEESVTVFRPKAEHTAIAGFVYGGLIASLVDCHSTGTAAAALYTEAGREAGSEPHFRCVTGSLHVDYLKPTPLAGDIVLRGRVSEIKGRKVTVETSVMVDEVETARGVVVAISVPPDWGMPARE